jgi:lipopolysaccharide/colanic/teichoic acid biosynthesis glycosyltransferase
MATEILRVTLAISGPGRFCFGGILLSTKFASPVLDPDPLTSVTESPHPPQTLRAYAPQQAKPEAPRPVRPSPWSTSAAKRLFDLACVAPALFLLWPVILAIAAAVRFSSKGPAMFRQTRAGLNRRGFTLYKFRTMRTGARGPGVTKAGDPRLTRLGAFLRKYKLDELPQLYNVLRGDMSLVGPRPKLLKFEQTGMPCRPGITGAATLAFANEEQLLKDIPLDQLDRFHVEVLSPAKRALDQSYQRRATFSSDLRLLFRTFFRVPARLIFKQPSPVPLERSESVHLQWPEEFRFSSHAVAVSDCESAPS